MNHADDPTTTEAIPVPAGWRHGSVPVVGLIGGMGAGKSWLASRLAERGALVVDADRVGHEVLEQPDVHARILREFGDVEDVSDQAPPGGRRIDRKALGRLAFADPARLDRLESIVHPAMRREFVSRISLAQAARPSPAMVVLDAAILLEAGWDDLCDQIVYVHAPDAIRHARLRETRGWTIEEIRGREAAQWPADRKRGRADLIVESDDDPAKTEVVLSRLAELLRSRQQTETPSRPVPTPGTPPGDTVSPAPSARRRSPNPSAR